MNNLVPTFAIPKALHYRLGPIRFLYASLCLLFFADLLTGAARAAELPRTQAASLDPGLSFSIADFDGDSKPDLATVQNGTSDSVHTNYRIQLQLSAVGLQSFQIAGPLGGLRIVSRDVNGDNAPDLVLTTAWLRQPVAILLNDGRGNFSRLDPGAWPRAFTESETNCDSTADHTIDSVGAPPQPRQELCSETEIFLYQRSRVRFPARPEPRFAVDAFLISHLGRAPPSKFLS